MNVDLNRAHTDTKFRGTFGLHRHKRKGQITDICVAKLIVWCLILQRYRGKSTFHHMFIFLEIYQPMFKQSLRYWPNLNFSVSQPFLATQPFFQSEWTQPPRQFYLLTCYILTNKMYKKTFKFDVDQAQYWRCGGLNSGLFACKTNTLPLSYIPVIIGMKKFFLEENNLNVD